jgi:hypothetical protein
MGKKKVLLTVGVCALVLSAAGVAAARTWPASIASAVVTSGGAQSCLSNFWGGSNNNCSSTLSVDFSGGSVIDTTNTNSGPWYVAATYGGYGPSCEIIGLDQFSTTYWSTGWKSGNFNYSRGSGLIWLYNVWVPQNGHAYAACQLSHNDQIDSIELGKP